MHDSAALASADFWELLAVLGLGTVLIVALAATAARLTHAATWTRTIWQAATLAVTLLLAVELTGLGRGLSWSCFLGTADATESAASPQPAVVAPSFEPSAAIAAEDDGGVFGPTIHVLPRETPG